MSRGYIEGYQEVKEQLWGNLNESGLFEQLRARSKHAWVVDPSEYTHLEIWSELGISRRDGKSGLWLSPRIDVSPARTSGKIFVPKLYHLSDSPDEQLVLARQIWQGVSHDDVYRMALTRLESLAEREQKGWLSLDNSIIYRKLHPASKRREVEIELTPSGAEYRVRVRD